MFVLPTEEEIKADAYKTLSLKIEQKTQKNNILNVNLVLSVIPNYLPQLFVLNDVKFHVKIIFPYNIKDEYSLLYKNNFRLFLQYEYILRSKVAPHSNCNIYSILDMDNIIFARNGLYIYKRNIQGTKGNYTRSKAVVDYVNLLDVLMQQALTNPFQAFENDDFVVCIQESKQDLINKIIFNLMINLKKEQLKVQDRLTKITTENNNYNIVFEELEFLATQPFKE